MNYTLEMRELYISTKLFFKKGKKRKGKWMDLEIIIVKSVRKRNTNAI